MKPTRIILVDHHLLFIDALALILNREQDIQVVDFFLKGEEAIHFALGRSPDLVLINLDMPQMSGLEICYHLSQANTGTHLILWGHKVGRQLERLAYTKGAHAVWEKDMPIEKLTAGIREILAYNR
ncbi:MAG: response regulator transcription factor [Bacteroidota bacterium]